MSDFFVTNNNDSGPGSLRQAILDASASPGLDTIDLTGVSGSIRLTSSLPALRRGNDLNIVDDGDSIIDGGSNHPILRIDGATVNISRFTLARGWARGTDGSAGGGGGGLGAGGALLILSGDVFLENVYL